MLPDAKDLNDEWWQPHIHLKRRPFLHYRQMILREIKNYFYNQGFNEVDATCLQISPGNETHISAFHTEWIDAANHKHSYYLHTSPEFMCKKLLAAGESKLFTFAKVFRNRERGPLHHPEFTMLEWYRTESLDTLYADVHELIKASALRAGSTTLLWRGKTADPFAHPQYLSVCEAFAHYAEIDLASVLEDTHAFTQVALKHHIRLSDDDTWSDIFSKIMTQIIEPHLGQDHLTFLTDYPASEAALAQLHPNDSRFAQRFEVYACGVELANGFAELTDPIEQRIRFEKQMNEKQRIYGEQYPIDEDFIKALALMPEASGIALGFERLIMLLSHAQHIDQVIWAPVKDMT